jgi:RNA polymerase sigma factor (sigma-70 family)
LRIGQTVRAATESTQPDAAQAARSRPSDAHWTVKQPNGWHIDFRSTRLVNSFKILRRAGPVRTVIIGQHGSLLAEVVVVLKLRAALRVVTQDVPPSDAELVGRYVADCDETAFAELVRRHGSAVFGVCRSVLGDGHDADDAFQATFLVLVRKAHCVTFRSDIAPWLFAVAMRASREVLRQRNRRRSRETSAEALEAPAPAPSDTVEDCRVLLDEIARLPETYRAPVVLCELTGVTRREAAKRLGIPEGTLSSRLAEARRRLARRLQSRGAVASVGVLATPVPAALAASVRDTATTSAVPSEVAVQLAEAVMRTTTFTPGKLVTVAALIVAVVGLSLGDEPSKTKVEVKPPAPNTKEEPHRLYAIRDGRLYSLDLDGSNEQRVLLSGTGADRTAQPAPDGLSFAYWRDSKKDFRSALVITDRHGKEIGKSVSLPPNGGFREFHWSPDGTQIHISQSSAKTLRVEHYTMDVKTREVKTLEMLRGHLVKDWSRDGKFFLTTKVGEAERWEPKSIHLMNTDGTEHKQLAAAKRWCEGMGLSPDGTRALCLLDGKLAVVNVADPKKPVFVEGIAKIPQDLVPEEVEVTGVAWSPDGKQIAYCTGTVQFLRKEQLQQLESVLVIADPTGKNAKVIRKVKGESFNSVYWR